MSASVAEWQTQLTQNQPVTTLWVRLPPLVPIFSRKMDSLRSRAASCRRDMVGCRAVPSRASDNAAPIPCAENQTCRTCFFPENGLPSLTDLGTFVRSAQKHGPFSGSPALRQSVRLTPYSLPSSMVFFVLFCFNPYPSPTGLGSQRPCRRAMGYFPGAPLSVSPCG